MQKNQRTKETCARFVFGLVFVLSKLHAVVASEAGGRGGGAHVQVTRKVANNEGLC